MSTRTLAELAVELGGNVVGDGSIEIRGVAGIREAQPGDLTFLANSRYEGYLQETRAAAVIVDRAPRQAAVPMLQVDHPYLAFQKAVRLFRPELYQPLPGVHPTAVVSAAAHIGDGASIGPHCTVEPGARIGAKTVLMPGCYVGVQATIGEGCLLYPRVTVREECVIGDRCILHSGAVIGADGFGFATNHSVVGERHPAQWGDAGRRHLRHAGTLRVGSVRIGQTPAHREPSKSSNRWQDLAREDGVAADHDGNADRLGRRLCPGAGRGQQRCRADDRSSQGSQ